MGRSLRTSLHSVGVDDASQPGLELGTRKAGRFGGSLSEIERHQNQPRAGALRQVAYLVRDRRYLAAVEPEVAQHRSSSPRNASSVALAFRSCQRRARGRRTNAIAARIAETTISFRTRE